MNSPRRDCVYPDIIIGTEAGEITGKLVDSRFRRTITHPASGAPHMPRDNVQLEYGISVGMLGRERSILLVDTDEEVKLASDQAGLTTLRF